MTSQSNKESVVMAGSLVSKAFNHNGVLQTVIKQEAIENSKSQSSQKQSDKNVSGGTNNGEEEHYLDEAEKDKQQYLKELKEFQQTEAYKLSTEKIQEKKLKKEELWPGVNGPVPKAADDSPDRISMFDTPIFTEEFLDQTKARESELRKLRKSNVEFEEQNVILQKHIETMNTAKEKLEQELALEERQTLTLQHQLQAVRQALTTSFASIPIPGTGETPTEGTLDTYMAKLHNIIGSSPIEYEKLVGRVQEIISQLDSDKL
ncbi:hypothetical protein chiPu_0003696 [Chiloscyllium punctatum]|uniref:Uncharacterized protein n=1 Tax=Chiloscyllium punctatum TaxID=137246 RepID=A0A401S4F3_CHIPU|nr:hypothetical protein [Chiloscyllium punctatum]